MKKNNNRNHRASTALVLAKPVAGSKSPAYAALTSAQTQDRNHRILRICKGIKQTLQLRREISEFYAHKEYWAGYRWEDYCQKFFMMPKSTAYEAVETGRVLVALENAKPEGIRTLIHENVA